MTAVLVAHDGAAWLPRVTDALLGQDRPVQRVVAVDTGSRDRSGSELAERLGQGAVFGMDRDTGYAAAVDRALAHPAASAAVPAGPGGGLPGGERTEWIWLLHDDCEPAPDALEQLLHGAAETPAAAVLGPKVRDWADRGVILEAGVTIDTAGRRVTGTEPREADQGQHDGDRDVLAVGSAGMLIRRDVFDAVGGFDAGLTMFMEDIDFCWRVHSAGYRVRVITDAVVYHAQAAARNRRPVAAGRARMLERRSSLITLLGNLPGAAMVKALAGNLVVSALRILFFLVAKRPSAAVEEAAAVAAVAGHPLRLRRARKLRAPGRKAAYPRLRGELPPGRSARQVAEFLATAMSASGAASTVGSHHASEDPSEDDFLLTDTGLAQRIFSSPAVLLSGALILIALIAERSLLGSGPLGGGALVPSFGGASDLWGFYAHAFHPAGVGSSSSAPPYLVVVAALATVLGGKPWLAVDVILLGSVPLAGMSAYLAARQVTSRPLVRAWAAAAYALLPVAMGLVAAARLGTAVVFILLPLIALLVGRVLTAPPRRSRRAAWAAGLLIAVGAAFVPLLWLIAAAAAVVAAIAARARLRVLVSLAIVVGVPPVLLLPWTLQLAAHPGTLLLETGLNPPALVRPGLPARALLLLNPGGPGVPAFWIAAGLAAVAVAALFAPQRRGLILTGWGIALGGYAIAVGAGRALVVPMGGGTAVTPWPGVPLLVAALGLLLAGAAAADSLPRRGDPDAPGAGRLLRGGGRLLAVLLVAAGFSAPVIAAALWLVNGVSGPVQRVAGPVVPATLSAQGGGQLQLRTLVLASAHGHISYALLRGPSPLLGEPDLIPSAAAQRALNAAVSALAAPQGGAATDQSQLLSRLGIGFVVVRAPLDPNLVEQINGVAGLRLQNQTRTRVVWRLTGVTGRVTLAEPGGKFVAIPSGPVGVPATAAPAAGGTLLLAEPAGGWTAALNGHPLTPVASPAGRWAQAFRLPPGGGTLTIGRDQLGRTLTIGFTALAVLVVAVLGLPGVRTAEDEAARPERGPGPGPGAGGRAGPGGRADRARHGQLAGVAAAPGGGAGAWPGPDGAGAGPFGDPDFGSADADRGDSAGLTGARAARDPAGAVPAAAEPGPARAAADDWAVPAAAGTGADLAAGGAGQRAAGGRRGGRAGQHGPPGRRRMRLPGRGPAGAASAAGAAPGAAGLPPSPGPERGRDDGTYPGAAVNHDDARYQDDGGYPDPAGRDAAGYGDPGRTGHPGYDQGGYEQAGYEHGHDQVGYDRAGLDRTAQFAAGQGQAAPASAVSQPPGWGTGDDQNSWTGGEQAGWAGDSQDSWTDDQRAGWSGDHRDSGPGPDYSAPGYQVPRQAGSSRAEAGWAEPGYREPGPAEPNWPGPAYPEPGDRDSVRPERSWAGQQPEWADPEHQEPDWAQDAGELAPLPQSAGHPQGSRGAAAPEPGRGGPRSASGQMPPPRWLPPDPEAEEDRW